MKALEIEMIFIFCLMNCLVTPFFRNVHNYNEFYKAHLTSVITTGNYMEVTEIDLLVKINPF